MKKLFLKISCFSIIFSALFFASGLSKQGSRGEEVKRIQTVLKNEGFYTSSIDGIFGNGTHNALISYQKAHNLKADGIAGEKTLATMGISTEVKGTGKLSSSDINLLARVISAEARGEPYLGQVAIGAVILNRIEHPSFPNTLAGVIYQPKAFSCLSDGQINAPITDSAKKAAQEAANGADPCGGAVYYYNPAKTKNKFMFSRPVITTIGSHKFCK